MDSHSVRIGTQQSGLFNPRENRVHYSTHCASHYTLLSTQLFILTVDVQAWATHLLILILCVLQMHVIMHYSLLILKYSHSKSKIPPILEAEKHLMLIYASTLVATLLLLLEYTGYSSSATISSSAILSKSDGSRSKS